MRVKLPRRCSGREIVGAFKAASTFQESPGRRWRPEGFKVQFQYERGSVRQTIRRMGVCVRPSSLKKKWGLFGEMVWKLDHNTTFTLAPVVLSDHYDAVRIDVDYVYEVDQGGGEYVATDPHSPEFEHIRPQLETILNGFYTLLA